MTFGHDKRLLRRLDAMLDDALAGTFRAENYDESLLSKIEAKTARFLDASQLRRDRTEDERERVRALIGDISHQTKTPLANVMLYAQLLAEQDLRGEQKELAAKNIALTAARGEASVALFDPRRCAEALFNIIDNAVKYTPENGAVTVSVTEYEMFVRVDVSDTGRGLREEDLPKVFARFWRAAESADSTGVGIGLYLAREIITACDGYIKVCSEYGKGATFSVFLSKAKFVQTQ